jgi:two-component system, sensor histidine kinase and response regulator
MNNDLLSTNDENYYKRLKMLDGVFDNAQVGIIVSDHEKKISYINSEFTRIFGYDINDAMSKDFWKSFFPKEVYEKNRDIIQRLEREERIEHETTRTKKDGKVIHVLCRISLIKDNGEITGACAIYSDISVRKRAREELIKGKNELEEKVAERTRELEEANKELKIQIQERYKIENELIESEERYRTAIENSNDGIAILKDGRHVYVNDRYVQIYGFDSKEEVYDTEVYALLHPEDREKIRKRATERVNEGLQGESYEHRGLKKDGSTIYVEVSVARTIYKNEPAGLAFIRDVNDRKKTEMELKKAKEEAERANSSKSEFLANMSHEIRTPMNAIMGMTGLLLDTDLDEAQMDHLEIIRRSSDALLNIINDILDFSKIEAGKMNLEILDFDLRSSIDEIVALPALSAQKKGIEFIYEIDPNIPSYLKGDPGRLRQIILNLTSNAVKFTDKGEVLLAITHEQEDEDSIKIKFSVRDTGIGISKEERDKLFQSFHQVDASTTRKYGGTGLGLVISKRLVGLMGGEIGVDSSPGKGSIFWFTVIMQKQKDVKEEELIPPEDLKGKRFLIVDDNKTNLQILQRYLEKWGFICDAAWSGEMGLTLMHAAVKAKAPYDVVISDMQMPYMDGKELGKMIKEDPALSDTKLIMLSSRGMRGDSADVKKIGFSAYLTKPIRRSHLFDCLAMVFGRKNIMGKSEAPVITRHSVSETKKKNIKILIAEDNIVNQKLALKLMEKFGYKADAVANGEEAVRSLGMIPYDLVLMDVQMPEMDGFQATKIIRDPSSRVINHDVPIIAMTAHAMSGDRKLCLDAGMDNYVAKPINPEELLKTMNTYISKKGNTSYLP